MRQAIGPLVERGAAWLERRGLGSFARFAYEPGPTPVRIDDLISPLRYDVIIRQDFLAFVRDERALARDDFPAFLATARRLPFFEWFVRVAIPEFHRSWGGDEDAIRASFAARVRSVVDLVDDLETHGYDPSRPIILRTGDLIEPTETGKRIDTPIYMGDGCHRLAWLRLCGATVLEPGTYRLQRAKRFMPRDVTGVVLRAMEIEPAEYFSFLSLAYAGERLESERALVEHVSGTLPQRLDELRTVIASDLPLLGAARDG